MDRQPTVNMGNLLLSLAEITDISNPKIAYHQLRTAFISNEIIKYSGADHVIAENTFTAALLHDIGALSVEEKSAVHSFQEDYLDPHCIQGEVFLSHTPWFKDIAKIVRNHHTKWLDWQESIDNPIVFASQVIFLADYVERLIDRSIFILHQPKTIIEKINTLKNIEVHEKIIQYFIAASEREEFWLDLISPRLYPILLYNGPLYHVKIDLDGILLISELFRDIIDFKSTFTATHTSGVSACAGRLAQFFGFSEVEVKLMRIAGNLHDVGKMVIPNQILEKPDKLTPEEFVVIKSHTYYSYYVIKTIGGLQQIAEWAAYHHEKLDGTGYPFRCKASEIDNGSRIMAVADIFTAVSEDRPYRKGMPKNDVYRILRGQADKNYIDRRIIDVLFDNYETIDAEVKEKQRIARDYYESRQIIMTQDDLKPHSDNKVVNS